MHKLLLWCCVLLFPWTSLAQQSSPFPLTQVFGTPLEKPHDIAVHARTAIYVLDNGQVTKLDAQGRFVAHVDPRSSDPAKARLANIVALSADATGNMYVVDKGAKEVRKFSPQGQLLLTFTHSAWTETLPGHTLRDLENVTIDAAGNVYVLEIVRVLKFDAQGRLQWIYDPREHPPVNGVIITSPYKDIVVDAKGTVFFLDYSYNVTCLNAATGQKQRSFSAKDPFYNNMIHPSLAVDAAGDVYTMTGIALRKCTPDGVFQRLLTPGFRTEANAMVFDDDNNLYVATATDTARYDHTGSAQLFKLTPAGQILEHWGNGATLTFLTQEQAGTYCVYDQLKKQIVKYGAGGQELLRYPTAGTTGPGALNGWVIALAADTRDQLYVLHYDSDTRRTVVKKFTPRGQYITSITLGAFEHLSSGLASLAVGPAGELYATDGFTGTVYKFDPAGRQLLHFGSRGKGPAQFEYPKALTIDLRGNLYVADINGHRIQKFSPAGHLLRESKRLTPADATLLRCAVGLSVDAEGNLFVGSTLDPFVQVYTPDGGLGPQIPGRLSCVSVNRQGTRLLASNYDRDAVHVFADAAGISTARASRISGRIFQDQTATCASQTAPGLVGVAVVAEPGEYYGFSDDNGHYLITTPDTGTYTVRQLLPTPEPGRTIRPTCPPAQPVRVRDYQTSVTGPDFGNQVSTAPYLNVHVASDRRRRCFRNVTTVAYTNTGFAVSAPAQVVVALPPHVLFLSADVPHTRDTQGNYVFSVGTLAPNADGMITIQDSVSCGDPSIRGLTVCTTAWITPANSYPTPPTWNAASLTVSGRAQPGNQARFTLTNTGKGATTDSLTLRVYQDTDLALQQRYSLAARDSLVLRVPATGRVVRVETDQPTGHPLKTQASATVELAARVTDGLPSPAMRAYPPDDREPEKAIDCQPILDSFDPNDKQVSPQGVTNQHYTPTNTPLRYLVRFQNTGNDVAYRVAVVDTLAAELDLRTLQVGAASHPYRLSVSGKTRPILTFTFDNILLPDSTSNEPGSHGFVQFSVQPKPGLMPKARIDNFADIYFDYNEPVRTNTTVNRIYDVPPVIDPTRRLVSANILVSPSIASFTPAQGQAGTLVTLTGTHFLAPAGTTRVLLQGVEAPVLSASATSLTVRVPPGAASGPLQVSTPDGAARSVTAFTVLPPATVTAGGGPTRSPSEAVSVYPNPTTGTVTVSWPATGVAVQQVLVLDGLGRRVRSRDVWGRSTQTLTLELTGQRAGLYLLVVQTAQGPITTRLTLL